MHGVVFVGSAEEEVEVAVEFEVPFSDVVCATPERMSCEFVDVEELEVPVPVALPAITVPIPNIVVDPKVVVRVVDPLVIVDIMAEVVIAEEVTDIVEEYDR